MELLLAKQIQTQLWVSNLVFNPREVGGFFFLEPEFVAQKKSQPVL